MILEPQIRPLREIDVQHLIDAAETDNHQVIKATHTIKKNDEFVGYLSIGAVPTVLFWLHTQKAKVRDAVAAVTFYENLVAPTGGVIVPVGKQSPFYALMEKAGYQNVMDGSIFMKGL